MRSPGAAGLERRPAGVSTGRSLLGRGSGRKETPGADKNYMVSANDAFAIFTLLSTPAKYQAITFGFPFL